MNCLGIQVEASGTLQNNASKILLSCMGKINRDPMKFKVTFNQSDLDKRSENNLHRFNTMTVSEDIPSIKIQLPIGYNGPANKSNKEIEYTPEDLYLGSLVGCFLRHLV